MNPMLPRWKTNSYPWVLFTFFLVIYILYPTHYPYIDGLYFAYHVEQMPLGDTFHPHHLFYLTLHQILFSLFHAVFPNLRGLIFFQTINSLLAAITLVVFYKMILRLFKRPLAAFLATFFYGSSFAFWHHATDANLYILFNLFLTILLSRFLFDKKFKETRHLVITALIMAFATFIHQLAIFLLLPVGAFLLIKQKDEPRDLKPFLVFNGVYLISVFIPYLLVFIFAISNGQPSIALFAKWVTAYGSNKAFWPMLYHDVFYLINVITRSQFNAILHVLPTETIIYRGGTDTGESPGLVNLFNFMFAMILMIIAERIHFINFRANPDDKLLYRKILAWMMPFFIFFMFFVPENYFYRIFYLAPLIIFAGGLIESSTIKDKRTLKPFIFIFVIFTFMYNAWDGIIPESKPINNPYFVDSRALASEIKSDALVVFADKERYLASTYRYYFDRKCLHAMSRMRYTGVTPEQLESAKNETATFMRDNFKSIYFSNEAIRMGVETYYFSLNNFPYPRPSIMLIDKDQIIQTSQIFTIRGTYFKVSVEKPSEMKKSKPIVFAEIDPSWDPMR